MTRCIKVWPPWLICKDELWPLNVSQNTPSHPQKLCHSNEKSNRCVLTDPLPSSFIHSLFFPLPLHETGKNSPIWESWHTLIWYSVLRQPNKGTWLFPESPVGQDSNIYVGDKIFKASQEIILFTVRPCRTSCHNIYVNMSSELKKSHTFSESWSV